MTSKGSKRSREKKWVEGGKRGGRLNMGGENGKEWINNEPLLYRIQRLYKWGKRPKNILYGIWHFSCHMCQFSQKLAVTSTMVSGNCQKHSEAWTEGEWGRGRGGVWVAVKVGVGDGGASIALLAGLNSSLRSFSCSHYKDNQRQRVVEQVTRGRKEKSPKEVKGLLVQSVRVGSRTLVLVVVCMCCFLRLIGSWLWLPPCVTVSHHIWRAIKEQKNTTTIDKLILLWLRWMDL